MKIEKLDRVCIVVRNLQEAENLFSDILGVGFHRFGRQVAEGQINLNKTITEHADRSYEEAKVKVSVSPIGLELIEMTPSPEAEGVRSFHFKVTDLEEAKLEMKRKGIRLVSEIELGHLKEAVYSPDDLHGSRLVLCEYQAPSAISAIFSEDLP